MELEAELDRLYSLPLGEFIGERNALAKRLRQSGDREDADRVKALVKPSLTAWVVNQLHFRAPEELAALVAAGEALRQAHLAGAEAHRGAMTARRAAISTLLAIAGDLLEEAGRSLSRVHRQRISRTLEAVANRGGEPGRLSRDLEPTGFDALSGLAAALGPPPGPRLVTSAAKPPTPARPRPREVPREAASAEAPGVAETIDFAAERRRRQDKARRERRREVEQVDRELGLARSTAEGMAAKIADLERQAAEAAGERSAADGAAVEAATAATEAERRAGEARERAREAREAAARARREAEAAASAAERAAGELAAARREVERLVEERRRLNGSP